MVWDLTPNGVFTTASAYKHIANQPKLGEKLQTGHDFKEIWKARIPNKIKHFLWILYHRRTKSNHRLHNLGMSTSPFCQICGYYKEDITHIFFKCYIATNFWREVHLSRRLQNSINGSSLESATWMDCWKSTKKKNALPYGLGHFFLTAFGKFEKIGIPIFLSTRTW